MYKKLKPGDLVYIVQASSFVKNNNWKQAVKILKNWGLIPYISKLPEKPWIFHSDSNNKRLQDLNQAFLKSKSLAVWMLKGGYGMQKLMPDFIKTYKKQDILFIGYSDATAMHTYLNSQNVKTLHAPSICELSKLSQKQLLDLKSSLFGVTKKQIFTRLSVFKAAGQKCITSRIFGGNLSLLSSSVGTCWFPKLPAHFLFIEDVNEQAYNIDRMLHHLLYSGYLKNVRALLFGSFYPLTQNHFKKTFLESFSKASSIPLIFGMPCGHDLKHKRSLFFNTQAKLFIDQDKATLQVSC